jgi:glycosyltransferase involved in cell wall biosynthesis
MNKYKILITAEFLCHENFTGIENYLYNLIHSLPIDKNLDFNVICPKKTPKQLIPQKIGIYYHDPISVLGTKFLSSLINPPKILDEFDLIHCPTVVAPFFFKPKIKKKQIIVMTVHDIIPLLFPKYNIFRRRIYFKYILKHRFKYVDYFIVPSQCIKNDLVKYFNLCSEKIKVIYEGVSKDYTPKNYNKENYILAVSTLEPRKNFERIIRCYLKLRERKLINENLFIIGKTGWYYNKIFEIPVDYKGKIHFLGFVSENKLIKYYQRAKYFVFPSLYEGFGLPVIEAMACGCPVITSNRSSLPEISGEAALLIDPENDIQLENAMAQLSNNDALRNELIKKGLLQVKKFKWNKCAEETVNFYKRVIKNENSSNI